MRLFSLSVVLAFLVAAPESAPAEQKISDDQIHDRVLQRLASDRDVKGGGIDVEVRDGVVTLRGKVREEKQKVKAEHVARKVKGVKKVVNELHTEMPASSRPAGRSAP